MSVTKRAGVIGHPVGHSISPAVFEAAFASAGIDATYEAWDTPPDLLEGRVNALRAASFFGANVTIPHKQSVMPLIDDVSETARLAGAVNTIVHEGGELVGHNTDVSGFARALREDAGFDARGKRTMILGSGGAASAVGQVLVEAGAAVIFVIGRHPRKVEQLVLSLKPRTQPGTTITWAYWGDGSYMRSLAEADLVVNCTPIGMRGTPDEGMSPVEPHLLASHSTVFDLVYNPAETPFLAAAKSRGAKPVPGLGMLIYQAAESFKLWTGTDADTGAMWNAARSALAQ